ncbi:MAG: hypothetical protein CVV06_20080, partial [Gammaproteobacteria bacterium HGW-Gammaproteobacteria-10]
MQHGGLNLLNDKNPSTARKICDYHLVKLILRLEFSPAFTRYISAEEYLANFSDKNAMIRSPWRSTAGKRIR